MTFNAIIGADTLTSFIDCQTTLVDEAKWQLRDDGLRVKAVDPANVGMADVTLDAAAFESYDADGGVIGVNLARLGDVVAMADGGDLVHLTLDAETRKLRVEFDGLEYTLALIDPDAIRQEPDIPDLDLPAEVVIQGRDLARGIKAADLVAKHLTLRADPDAGALVIEASGDTDDATVTLTGDDVIRATVPEAVSSYFSLDYCSDIETPISADTEVTIDLGDEFPMKLHYEIAAGDGSVTNMLAPRIQSD